MKIDYAIMSCDNNPLYVDFWEPISKVWKLKFNIHPILLLISDEILPISTKYGDIIRINYNDDFPSYIQAQWARYWYLARCNDCVGIISDIDMIPLSRKYFIDKIKDIPNDHYVHLNPCLDTYPRIPGCYHVCGGKLFREIMEIPEHFDESLNKIIRLTGNNSRFKHFQYWFSDENYTTQQLIKYKLKENLHFLKREDGQNGFRIDRTNFQYDPELLKKEYYYDCHSIRPYKQYKNEIDKLISIFLEE